MKAATREYGKIKKSQLAKVRHFLSDERREMIKAEYFIVDYIEEKMLKVFLLNIWGKIVMY